MTRPSILALALALCVPAGCKSTKKQTSDPTSGMQAAPASMSGMRDIPRRAAPRRTPPRRRAGPVRFGPIPPTKLLTKKDPRAIIAACIKRLGGKKRLMAVKTLRYRHVVQSPLEPPPGRVTFQFPDKLKNESLSADQYSHILVLNGTKGFYKMRGKKTKGLAKHQRRFSEVQLRAHPIAVLQAAVAPKAQLTYRGETRVGKRTVDRVTVSSSGLPVDLFIARDDGELLAQRNPTSGATVLVLYTNIREVGGIRLAYTHTLYLSTGGGGLVDNVTGFTVNPKLPATAFDPEKHTFDHVL